MPFADLRTEGGQLVLQGTLAECAFHEQAEVLGVGGFGEKVVGAQPHGLDGVVDAAVAGGDDDGHGEAPVLDLLDQLHAIELGHPQVGDDDAVRLLEEHRQRLGAIDGEIDVDAQGHAQQLLERLARILFVLDQEDPPGRLERMRQVHRAVAGAGVVRFILHGCGHPLRSGIDQGPRDRAG